MEHLANVKASKKEKKKMGQIANNSKLLCINITILVIVLQYMDKKFQIKD